VRTSARERGGAKMRSVHLLALALGLVVMCNSVSVEEGDTQYLEKAKSRGKAEDVTSKKKMAANELLNTKNLLPLPGMPDWAIVMKRMEDVDKRACHSACNSDPKCAGFQYISSEQLCQLFKHPRRPDQSISLKKAKRMMKQAVAKGIKEAKSKASTKLSSSLNDQQSAMAPVKKNPSLGAKFREADKKLAITQRKYKRATSQAKESARKSRGARAAEIITKTHEHDEMMLELHAAKEAQAAGLNFEEQVIMAKSPTSKNVIIAKAHKKTMMHLEEKADASFEEAKVVMKKGLVLQAKMKEIKVKRVEAMVRDRTKMNNAEAKHKIVGRAYKTHERQQKNARDEQKEKTAAQARIYLKAQNKKAERHAKAVESATTGNKEAKIKKCRKSQVKMRKLKFKLYRRLKKQIYKRERKVASRKVKRLKKGLQKAEERKAKNIERAAVKAAHKNVRRRFDMSETELADVLEEEDLGEGRDLATETQQAKAKAEKTEVDAEFKKKEYADAVEDAASKSKEVAAKSEELNQLKLELAGKPKDPAPIQTKLGALQPELAKAQTVLKKAEDHVTSLKNSEQSLERSARDAKKEAQRDQKSLAKNQDAKAEAKIKAQQEVAKAKKEARKDVNKLRKQMMAKRVKKSRRIRRHIRRKAKQILKTKWIEMKRTLKLKTVKCDASKQTETQKLKRKLKMLKATMARVQSKNSRSSARAKRKAGQEKRAKARAKTDMQVKLKEFENTAELKEKKAIKENGKEAAKEIAEAKADEAKEKTIASANEKKADIAMAQAKAEGDKLKMEEQTAAAGKLEKSAEKSAPKKKKVSPAR